MEFQALSCPVSGLTADTPYYFTFRAVSDCEELWAPEVLSFTPVSPPSPAVDNDGGAENLATGRRR